MSDKTQDSPELRQFEQEIHCLLEPQDSLGRSLDLFIARTLRQFHLEGTYISTDVFNEAYIRGVAFIRKGNEINHPFAWMRSTAYNVIREYSRYERKYQSIDTVPESLLVTEEMIDLDLEAVSLALKELESSDRRIIELWRLEGLSWREVRQCLVDSGETVLPEAALRKRGQRAMQKLRQAYHKIRPPQTLVH